VNFALANSILRCLSMDSIVVALGVRVSLARDEALLAFRNQLWDEQANVQAHKYEIKPCDGSMCILNFIQNPSTQPPGAWWIYE
jgi:hypothetical protein